MFQGLKWLNLGTKQLFIPQVNMSLVCNVPACKWANKVQVLQKLSITFWSGVIIKVDKVYLI
ncbi:hypothetical protein VI06_21130 [Aquitalea magnusonii]|nr:hypothetical protein VI06_21130 [Aquitalea magnusonii]